MNVSALLNKIGRYGAIGMLAAAVHAAVLLLQGDGCASVWQVDAGASG